MSSREYAVGRAVFGSISRARGQLAPVDTELGAGIAGEEVHVRQSGPTTPLAVELLLSTVDIELEPTGPVVLGVDDETKLVLRASAERNGPGPDDLTVGTRATRDGVLDSELVVVVKVDVEGDVLRRCDDLIAFLPVLVVICEQKHYFD